LEGELFELRKAQKIDIPDLASLDEKITTFGEYSSFDQFSRNTKHYNWRLEITWRDLFALISPYLLDHPNDTLVKSQLASALFDKTDKGSHSARLDDQIYQTIKIQLQALGLIKVQYLKTTGGGMGLFWSLTQPGYGLMMSLRTVKSTNTNAT
jgi:two-component SAPR family response regulator